MLTLYTRIIISNSQKLFDTICELLIPLHTDNDNVNIDIEKWDELHITDDELYANCYSLDIKSIYCAPALFSSSIEPPVLIMLFDVFEILEMHPSVHLKEKNVLWRLRKLLRGNIKYLYEILFCKCSRVEQFPCGQSN